MKYPDFIDPNFTPLILKHERMSEITMISSANWVHEDEITNEFIDSFDNIQTCVHDNAVDKGFWEASQDDGTKIALMHSELSEALEALRKPHLTGKLVRDDIDLLTEELADTVIRIMDFAESKKLPLARAIVGKARINTGREQMHGGKKF